MKISDEIRRWCDDAYSGRKIRTTKDLYAIAELIDRNMVELPKDMDGEPIHVGDTVYGCRSGMKMTISELRMTANGWSISTSSGYLTDAEVTHGRHDSLERIAKDMEDWSDDNRINWSSDVSDRAAEFAHRICKLAKEDDK